MSFSDEREESFFFLAQTNNTCEWLWKIYFQAGLAIQFLACFVPNVISVLSCYINYGSFKANHVFHGLILR